MRKKVLIITPFNPEGIGGAETFTLQLIEEIKKTVMVKLLTCPTEKEAWDEPSIKDCVKKFIYLLPRAIWQQIKFKPQTVHCLGLIGTSVGMILKWIFRVKLISTTLALYDPMGWSPLKLRVASFIFNQADKVFVEDNIGRYEMTYLYVPQGKIINFMHWVDLDRFKPGRPQHKKMHVLFIGRPIPKKGRDIIEEVEKEFKERKLKAVFTYVENVPYKDLPNYYERADVFVIPSKYHEGVARVVLEAAASGCAVVSSNSGSLRELVAQFGITISPFADTFRRELLKLYMDPKLLENYKQASRIHAMANFSAKNAEVFLNEYR